MKRPIAALVLVGAFIIPVTGCSNLLYLPSDAVNEEVVVTTDEDLRDQITVSADYCDEVVVQGSLSNNATSDASVEVTIGLDDGETKAELRSTVFAPAGATTAFEIPNADGVNPMMGCSATVQTVTIVTAP